MCPILLFTCTFSLSLYIVIVFFTSFVVLMEPASCVFKDEPFSSFLQHCPDACQSWACSFHQLTSAGIPKEGKEGTSWGSGRDFAHCKQNTCHAYAPFYNTCLSCCAPKVPAFRLSERSCPFSWEHARFQLWARRKNSICQWADKTVVLQYIPWRHCFQGTCVHGTNS